MFDVRRASYEIHGACLLHPVDVTFDDGHIHGLIGHNGSGKTTLLRLLARQQMPTGGEIRFDGCPLSAWGNRAFAREVAYLPQDLPSAANLTGRELVAFGRYPWRGLLGRLTSKDHAQIDRAIALTQTGELADRLVETLSGGERQRVWIAMLLAQGSRYLLLDEPLAALDIAHQVEVLTLVRQLSRDLGLGVVIVLHDINMAARYCDRLVALHSGRMLAQGTPGELMCETTLEAIYGIPMQVMAHPAGDHGIAVVH